MWQQNALWPPLLAMIEMGQSLNGLKCVKWPEDSCINQLQLPQFRICHFNSWLINATRFLARTRSTQPKATPLRWVGTCFTCTCLGQVSLGEIERELCGELSRRSPERWVWPAPTWPIPPTAFRPTFYTIFSCLSSPEASGTRAALPRNEIWKESISHSNRTHPMRYDTIDRECT